MINYEKLDRVGHKLHLPNFIQGKLCAMADVSYGWSPCNPNDTTATPFAKWFFNWYWRKKCHVCFGSGEIHILHPKDITVKCEGCNGTGKRCICMDEETKTE